MCGFSIILHNNVHILKKCLLKQKNKGKGGVGGRQKIDKNNAKCYTEKRKKRCGVLFFAEGVMPKGCVRKICGWTGF